MGQDLRELFKEQREKEKYQINKGHETRFFEKLETELSNKRKSSSYFWLKIAASVLVLVGLTGYLYTNYKTILTTTIVTANPKKQDSDTTISLGDLSPDLEKIENYYIANINLELANLEISEENMGVVDGYMEQLEILDAEYKSLNKELNTIGPNDQTIEASIQNLQLRLELLKKLQEKLNQIKLSKNEQTINT